MTMTQEEKAKAYDMAIEGIQEILSSGEDSIKMSRLKLRLQGIFHELKESEDERIRKALLESFEYQIKESHPNKKWVCGVKLKEIVAWLEKQGKYETIWKPTKEQIAALTHFVRSVGESGYASPYDNNTKLLYSLLTDLQVLEKQGQSKKTSIWKHWKDGIAGNGDNIPVFLIKNGLTYSLSPCLSFECDYIELSELDNLMLEKQGESDETKAKIFLINKGYPIDTNGIFPTYEEMYNIIREGLENQGEKEALCDKCRKEHPSHSCQDITALGRCTIEHEQKSSDRGEPKFKIGDFIVNDYCKGKVIALTDDAYLLDTGQGIPFSCEHNIHLWSIFDARDGDVLVDVYGNIGIYEKCYDFDWMSYCSLGYNGGFQHFKIEHENEKTYPATKEQQNLLFSKMQEDGWYWNPETKELSQSQVTKSECWSEEDDYNLQCMIAKAVKDIQNGNVGRNQELIDWLKSLKNRIQPRQNACGEEQDNVTSMIKAHCVKLT